jgi:cytochrome c-type biogenesis protein CcmH
VNAIKFLLCFAVLLASAAQAVIETYDFDDKVQRQRYNQFVMELRCPKCQNQNLSGSDAPIAADLRRELHSLIIDGRSDQEITQFMLDRYGDFVLYRPRFTAETAVLWLSPVLLLTLGFGLWWRQTRRSKVASELPSTQAPANNDMTTPLSPAEQQRLDKLLAESSQRDTNDQ